MIILKQGKIRIRARNWSRNWRVYEQEEATRLGGRVAAYLLLEKKREKSEVKWGRHFSRVCTLQINSTSLVLAGVALRADSIFVSTLFYGCITYTKRTLYDENETGGAPGSLAPFSKVRRIADLMLTSFYALYDCEHCC